jgi:Domain of unknown function (DUF3859)
MKKLLTFPAALLLVAAISRAACAQAIQQIDVIDLGIYRANRIKQEDAPTTPAGILGHVVSLELLEATTTIPALRGVRFGFAFKIAGQSGAKVRLKFVILIPQPGIQRGGTESSVVRGEYFQTLVVGELSYFGYKFDYPWEVVLGKWTLEIWDGSRRLTSQAFYIAASSGPAPILAMLAI